MNRIRLDLNQRHLSPVNTPISHTHKKGHISAGDGKPLLQGNITTPNVSRFVCATISMCVEVLFFMGLLYCTSSARPSSTAKSPT